MSHRLERRLRLYAVTVVRYPLRGGAVASP